MSLLRSVLAAALVLGACPARAQQEAPAGSETSEESAAYDARLVSFEGDVTVVPSDGGDEITPEQDMPLSAGDRIKTGPDSKAEVSLDGGDVLELGARTEFAVESLERQESSFSLSLGVLVAKVRTLLAGRMMRVRTPTAVAAVRGTEFGVEVDAEETHVGVYDEGQVAVSPPEGVEGEAVTLGRNEEISARRGAKWRELRARRLERFKRHHARMQFLRQRLPQLRQKWRSLPPERRQEIRKKMIERRHKMMREIKERRQKLKRGDRKGLDERREKIRQKLRERRRGQQ